MTTTPTVWRPSFTVNAGFTGANQTVPQTIGLANGNILVVWEDTSDVTGPSPFTDIVGRILDPEGNPVGSPFQLNVGIVGSDETGPKIVALPDGGFAMAYGGYDPNLGGFIAVQRYNSDGQAPWGYNLILDTAHSSLTKWEITADATGNYTVVFERVAQETPLSPLPIDIHSFTYDFASNIRGPERTNIAQNSPEDDRLAATAAFSNGHVIAFYTEPDYDFAGNRDETAEFRIIDPVTGDLLRNTELDDGDPLWDTYAKDVAVLTDGQFVLVYFEPHFPAGYGFRVVNTETSAVGPHVDIPDLPDANGIRYDRGICVVALQDGGFFIASLETAGVLYGQRYGAYGDTIGARFPIAQNVGAFTSSNLSLASDGRILVAYRDTAGEIAQVILDPRETAIFGTDDAEVLTTQIANTVINGGGGDDTILGQGANDTINGGADRDTLDGGAGNDTYVLADLALLYIFLDPVLGIQAVFGYDNVIEAVGGGTDTVRVRWVAAPNSGYTLASNVESGYIEGGEVFDLSGNEIDNYLFGNSASNRLEGLGGSDRLYAGSGNDTLVGGGGVDTMAGGGDNDRYFVDNAGDVVVEGVGEGTADRVLISVSYALGAAAQVELFTTTNTAGTGAINLTGNGFVQTMHGNAGVNVLNGGGGADTMVGFAGDDRYFVDNVSDTVVEGAGQGTADRVLTSVNYTLGAAAQVELFTTTNTSGTGAINLTGNGFDQVMHGNAGDNVLNGGGGADNMTGFAGDDWYYVDNADDVVLDGAGQGTADRVFASVSFVLTAGAEIEILSTNNAAGTAAINFTGNGFGQSIGGNAGDNVLFGGGGDDSMVGFGGNDRYFVDSLGDSVLEQVGGGNDRVSTSVSYTLTSGQEIELFTTTNSAGTGAINLTGNNLAQSIGGNAGANVLNGGLGNDTLTGFGGADTFFFNTALGATNIDVIADYNVAQDTIHLENAIFAGLAAGALTAGAFNTGAAATEGDDRIVYNAATGALIFDADGLGGAAGIQFATLSAGLALTSADFFVV